MTRHLSDKASDQAGQVRPTIRLSSTGLTVGTALMTPSGTRNAEDLRRGDRVLTKDFGYQQIKCVAFRDADLRRNTAQAPIKLSAHCLGHERPMEDTYVSPHQRLAVRHPLFDPIFGNREVVACAGHLADLVGVEQVTGLSGITYISLGFARPQLVLTGSLVLDLGGNDGAAARPVLSLEEARLACGLLNPQTLEAATAGLPLH